MVLPAFSSFMTCWKSACLSQRSCRFLSVPLQNGFCFFQHPLPANLSATLARRLPRFSGEACGVSMFWFSDRTDLAPAFAPAVWMSVWPVAVIRPTDCFTFWLQPISVFGWSMLTMSTAVHICWACRPV